MKKLELKCTVFSHKSRKYNSYKGTIGKIADNKINRRFTTSVSNQKITTDTTEFKIYNRDDNRKISIKKAYLDPFLDMFNEEILSYTISEKPNFNSIKIHAFIIHLWKIFLNNEKRNVLRQDI